MDIEEVKVLVSSDGLARVAVVRREDGLFCLYEHWYWSAEAQKEFNIEPVRQLSWSDLGVNRAELYDGMEPLPGVYGSIELAEKAAILRIGDIRE